MVHNNRITLHTPRKGETAKYGYSLFLLLGTYLLYHEGISNTELTFLSVLFFLAMIAGFFDTFSHSPLFQQWLNRWF